MSTFASRVTYISNNAAQVIYTFTFDYIDSSYIAVYADDVLETGYTVVPGQITLAAGVAIGVELLIQRETPVAPLVTWSDGAVITENDLDTMFLQCLHVAVEATDDSVDGMQLNAAGTAYDAVTKPIENVGAPTVNGDAARFDETDALDTRVTAAEGSITTLEGTGDGNALREDTDEWDAQSQAIKNVLDGTQATDAVNKAQMEDLSVSRGAGTQDFTAHTKRIKDVVDPVNAQDAATKAYADSVTVASAPDGSITNAKLANMAQNTIKGNDAILGVPKDLTAAETRALLNVADGATADQTDAEIRTAVEAATDSNVFTDADHTNLNNQSGTNTGDQDLSGLLAKAGGTMTGDVNLGDNVKLTLGAGSDLEIYHDGLNTYIEDKGTGNLIIGATNLRVRNATGTKWLLLADDGGVTELYYDGVSKFFTNTTGVTVAGNITMNSTGLVDGRDVAADGTRLDNTSGTNTGDQTNITGNAATVTTNANLTGPVTSTGNATAIAAGAISNAMLANGAVANLTGTNTGDQTNITGNAGTVTNGVYTTDIGTSVLAPNGSAASLTSFPTLNQNTTGNAATVTTNANLTGPVTSVGNATSVGALAITSAMINTGAVTNSKIGALAVDTAQIALQAVTLAKIDAQANNTILGNNAGVAGSPIALTKAQTQAVLTYPTVTTGAANPTTTPTTIGDIYYQTTDKLKFEAYGTATSADWKCEHAMAKGYWTLNGASPPTLENAKNLTITRTNVGLYTGTIPATLPNTDANGKDYVVHFTYIDATTSALGLYFVHPVSKTATTFDFRLRDNQGTLTDSVDALAITITNI